MNNKNYDNILAFVKYEGELVEEGYLDARKSGEALVGLDELLRFFIYQENPEIKKFNFEIPVRTRKGSWETIFPENIDSLAFKAFGLWMAGKYLGSALEEIAKNDFKDVSLKELIKKSFTNIIQVIKLAKHLGTLARKKFETKGFSENNHLVNVINDNGDEIWIPVNILELYSNCPQTLFNNLSKLIEEERTLIFSVKNDTLLIEESITIKYKEIFLKNEEDESIVLPELNHGDYVELQGHITRGNEKSNTIGFLYDGHIITCYPDNGNIKRHKGNLFNNCLLKGFVDRHDREGRELEKRPRIRFIEIVNIEIKDNDLFS